MTECKHKWWFNIFGDHLCYHCPERHANESYYDDRGIRRWSFRCNCKAD